MSTKLKLTVLRLIVGFFKALRSNDGRAFNRIRAVSAPVRVAGRYAGRAILVPGLRAVLHLRRITRKYGLTTGKLLINLIAHRSAVHAAVILVSVSVGVLNLRAREVRADNYGERSVLYSIIAGGGSDEFLEEGIAFDEIGEVAPPAPWYQDSVSAAPHMDDINFEDEVALNPEFLGGGVISAQPADPLGIPVLAARTTAEFYVVRPGDTLASIAARFGLKTATILWENKLTERSVIRPGDRLNILPTDGVTHTVKKAENVDAIAKRYNASKEQLLAWNALPPDGQLRVGERLMVPGGRPPAPPAAPRVARPRTGGPVVARGSVVGTGTMVWPTDWRVITQYFRWRHSGLDIDGDYNTKLYASDSGVVTHAGWGRTRGGYGIYIDVDHGNGLVTRYGHASKLFVSVGDQVTRGQAIGMVGTTGRSTGTHLHFEVIKGGRKLNPLQFIR